MGARRREYGRVSAKRERPLVLVSRGPLSGEHLVEDEAESVDVGGS